MPLQQALTKLSASQSLSSHEMEDIFAAIFQNKIPDEAICNFLVLLTQKGETDSEILGATNFLRNNAIVTNFKNSDDLLDCCGTGGDQKGTLNISTAVAFVLAGGGVKVAKHGNTAVSSKSGSADVLKELGVNIQMSPETAIECLKKTGIAFLWAPQYYPILKKVAAVRKSIPGRTIFNLLGPLLNPLKATQQLLGVFDKKFVPVMAQVLRDSGAKSFAVVSSDDGLDEFSLSAKAHVATLNDGKISESVFDPWQASGYPVCSLEDLKGGTPVENALRIRKSLKGHSQPVDHVIHINAAWGFVVAGMAQNFMDGLLLAQQSVSSGRAYQKLEELVEQSRAG